MFIKSWVCFSYCSSSSQNIVFIGCAVLIGQFLEYKFENCNRKFSDCKARMCTNLLWNIYLWSSIKWKPKILNYHTVGTFPKSYSKIVEMRHNRYPLTQKHDHSLYFLAVFKILVEIVTLELVTYHFITFNRNTLFITFPKIPIIFS